MKIKSLSKNELIVALFKWSYKNDFRLYANMDDHFSNHSYSGLVTGTTKDGGHWIGSNQQIQDLLDSPDFSPEEILIEALSKCDYHDSRRFYWTFTSGGSNRADDYKFKSDEVTRYSFMLDLINRHENELKKEGLDSFRKSKDVEKHKWYRGRLQTYLKMDVYNNNAELLVCYGGDSRVNTIFGLEIYSEYLQYILDNHIVSDPHRTELDYRPFGFKDYRIGNGFKIKSLMEPMGGLIYLNTLEMMEIYKSIPRHKIPSINKAEWAYIQSLSKNNFKDVKFYINLEK